MELSQFTDYSLRVLIYVAVESEQRSSIKEIASAYDISQNHLVKVVHHLSKQGFLDTFRGRGGGIALARAPETISVGEVVRKSEKLDLVECFSAKSRNCCCLAGHCELQIALTRAKNAFLAELDKVSLSDLTTKREQLGKLLRIGATP